MDVDFLLECLYHAVKLLPKSHRKSAIFQREINYYDIRDSIRRPGCLFWGLPAAISKSIQSLEPVMAIEHRVKYPLKTEGVVNSFQHRS